MKDNMLYHLQTLLTFAAWLSLLVGASATLAGFLGRLWWVFDLFSHFRLQYLIFFLAVGLLFAGLRQFLGAGTACLFAGINLALILPVYLGSSLLSGAAPAHAGGETYRLLLANVLQQNRQYEKMAAVIQTEQPDFIVLVEVNKPWINLLAPTLQDYPFSLLALRDDNYGLAIFSSFPIEEGEVLRLKGLAIPTLAAAFEVGGKRLTIVGAHPPPPKGKYLAEQRNIQFADLARYASNHSGPVILAGDLNTSSWSPHFTDLVRGSGLRDSRNGFGLQCSWPTQNPFLLTSIDHILVPTEVKVLNRRIGPATGSDHFPVILDFSLHSD
jgi:endonuclease/exonuclease/phosphatase (EEP) superfamily protein YafD